MIEQQRTEKEPVYAEEGPTGFRDGPESKKCQSTPVSWITRVLFAVSRRLSLRGALRSRNDPHKMALRNGIVPVNPV